MVAFAGPGLQHRVQSVSGVVHAATWRSAHAFQEDVFSTEGARSRKRSFPDTWFLVIEKVAGMTPAQIDEFNFAMTLRYVDAAGFSVDIEEAHTRGMWLVAIDGARDWQVKPGHALDLTDFSYQADERGVNVKVGAMKINGTLRPGWGHGVGVQKVDSPKR